MSAAVGHGEEVWRHFHVRPRLMRGRPYVGQRTRRSSEVYCSGSVQCRVPARRSAAIPDQLIVFVRTSFDAGIPVPCASRWMPRGLSRLFQVPRKNHASQPMPPEYEVLSFVHWLADTVRPFLPDCECSSDVTPPHRRCHPDGSNWIERVKDAVQLQSSLP